MSYFIKFIFDFLKCFSKRIFSFLDGKINLSFFLSTIFVLLLLLFPQYIYAQGLNIPSGSTVNVNAGTLNVGGSIDNDGTLTTTTGSVKLTGNWDNTNGTYTPTTGTLDFSGTTAAQTILSGGIAAGKLFYNLSHSGTQTVTASTNDLNVDNNFTNSAGTFATGGRSMTVAGAWANTATFTHGSSTVTLDGTDQTINGSTTFYNLTKTLGAAPSRTLTFQNTGEQIIEGTLTLQGFGAGDKLVLNSDDDDASPSQFGITLKPGGLQSMQYLNVKNSVY